MTQEEKQSLEIPLGAFDSEFIKDEYLIPEGCEARIEGNKVIIEKIQKEEPSSIEELLNIIVLQEIEYWRTHDKILKQDFNKRAKQVLDLARNEILKDAVDAWVNTYESIGNPYDNEVSFITNLSPSMFRNIEMVKIIIIKENKQ